MGSFELAYKYGIETEVAVCFKKSLCLPEACFIEIRIHATTLHNPHFIKIGLSVAY
jgi:hypothetical protein